VLFVISVIVYQKEEVSKSKNRKLTCYYCEKTTFHSRRHISRVHEQEDEVAAALSSGDRTAISQIMKCRIFNHNVKRVKREKGNFVRV
jgi:hypothetical protein